MSKAKGKENKTAEVKNANKKAFVWTDDEVELLLSVVNDYKVSKAMVNTDWESCQSKYTDILELFKQQYPSSKEEAARLGKDYPHNADVLSKAIITTKMKAIRVKYRHAVDSGRKSGHGRVVLLYFDYCEKIWGGSPATTTLESGIETTEISVELLDSIQPIVSVSPSLSEATNCAINSNAQNLVDSDEECSSPSPISITEIDRNTPAPSLSSTSTNSETNSIKERRDKLNSRLKNYKGEKLKRKIPADVQMMRYAQEDVDLKKRLMDKMDNMENDYAENMNRLSSNIDKLTSSITDGFSVLKNLVPSTPQPPQLCQIPQQYAQHIGNYASTYPGMSRNASWTAAASTSQYPNSQLPFNEFVIRDDNEHNGNKSRLYDSGC